MAIIEFVESGAPASATGGKGKAKANKKEKAPSAEAVAAPPLKTPLQKRLVSWKKQPQHPKELLLRLPTSRKKHLKLLLKKVRKVWRRNQERRRLVCLLVFFSRSPHAPFRRMGLFLSSTLVLEILNMAIEYQSISTQGCTARPRISSSKSSMVFG